MKRINSRSIVLGVILAALALLACAYFLRVLSGQRRAATVSTHGAPAAEEHADAHPLGAIPVQPRPPETEMLAGETTRSATGAETQSHVGENTAETLNGPNPRATDSFRALMAASMASSHNGLCRRLRLSPEQEVNLREILNREDDTILTVSLELQRMAAAGNPSIGIGEVAPGDLELMKKVDEIGLSWLQEETHRQVAAVLTAGQLAVYDEYMSNSRVHFQEACYYDSIMLEAPDLSPENCQRAAEVLVEERLAYAQEHLPSAKPDEYMEPYAKGSDIALRRARERLSHEFSPEQLHVFDRFVAEEQRSISGARRVERAQKVFSWLGRIGLAPKHD